MPAAPPQFPFYAADFVEGTLGYTTEERGAYLMLLIYQWSVDGVPGDDPRALAAIVGLSSRKVARIWSKLRAKFVRDPEGLYRNRRLEAERAKQLAFSALQSQKGIEGARKRWNTDGRGYSRGNGRGNGRNMAYQVRTSVQQATLLLPSTPNDLVREREVPAASRGDFHNAEKTNGPEPGRVAAALRDLPRRGAGGDLVGGLERANSRPADRAQLPTAASGATRPSDERPLVLAAADAPEPAVAAADAARPDDHPVDAPARVDDDARVGPCDEDRARLRMLKAHLGSTPARLLARAGARGRSRHPSGRRG